MGRQTFRDDEPQVDITNYRFKREIIELFDEETFNDIRNGVIPNDELVSLQDRLVDYLDMQTSELNSIASVFSTADRILLNDSGVKVQIYKPTHADMGAYDGIAGWSDGRNIMLNADIVKAMSENDVVALNGLNYHEVCHALYTPRAGSELVKWVVENNVQVAMNYLEDMRIETLFTARFPSTRAFLEANFYDFVATNGVDSNVFLLTRGRKYIPLEIRQAIADAFIAKHGVDMAERVANIIDSYRTLVLPQDSERAKELIVQFADIVGRGNNPQGQGGGDGGDGGESGEGNEQQGEGVGSDDSNNKKSSENITCKFGCGERDPMKAGRMLGKSEQLKDQQKVKDFDRNTKSEQLSGRPEGNNASDGSNSGSDSYEDTLDSEGLPQDKSKVDPAIKELIEKRAKEIRNDERIKREVQNFTDAVESNDSFMGSLRQARYRDENIRLDGQWDDSARRFGRELEQLQIETEQTWLREQSSGRLNIDRAMHADINSIDRVFDRWQEADYSTEIEAVILLDNSGSMGWRIQNACMSAWALKRGLEQIHANTTVYAFNSGSRLLYSASDKAEPFNARVLNTGGTTNPLMALNETEKIFNMSSRTTKMLFIVTDGGFDDYAPCDAYIKQFNEMGVITSTVFIGHLSKYDSTDDASIEYYRHYAKYFNVISDPADLVNIASDIVQGEIGVKA